jgi:hypothetical protein
MRMPGCAAVHALSQNGHPGFDQREHADEDDGHRDREMSKDQRYPPIWASETTIAYARHARRRAGSSLAAHNH